MAVPVRMWKNADLNTLTNNIINEVKTGFVKEEL